MESVPSGADSNDLTMSQAIPQANQAQFIPKSHQAPIRNHSYQEHFGSLNDSNTDRI